MTEEELLQQPEEDYMNDQQQALFHQRLLLQRHELQDRINDAFDELRKYESSSDPSDDGSTEEQREAQLRLLRREEKLVEKIDRALQRLVSGEYGWCEETGEPIGLPRLLLQPTATLSFEAKEWQENLQKHLRQH